jgi:Lipocalin-like domain
MACSKSSTTTNTTPIPKKDLLTRMWKISEAYRNGQINSDAALNDYRITFNQNGLYTVINGTPPSGSWEFNTDQTKIIMDKGSSTSIVEDIIELSQVKLRVKFNDAFGAEDVIFIPA